MKFYCSGLYGGGDYYISPEEGLRNNLLLHSGPIFSHVRSKYEINMKNIGKLMRSPRGHCIISHQTPDLEIEYHQIWLSKCRIFLSELGTERVEFM